MSTALALADGFGFSPRVKEPESALIPGMASPRSPQARGKRFGVNSLSMPDTSISGGVALQEPPSWVYDFDPGTGSARATFNGIVAFTSGGSGTAGVTTWNGRSGAVSLTTADVTAAGGATANNTVLTGNPTAPTPPPGDADTSIATTAFVAQAIVANPITQSFNGRTGAVTLTQGDVTGAGGAPAASPALTGVPTTPTAAPGNAGSQIASTQFVANAIAGGTVVAWNGRQGNVSLTLSDVQSVGGAPIASPSFTGVPLVPTAAPGTATTQAASTAFVTNAVVAASAGVASFNTRTGAVVLNATDITSAGGLPSVSGNMTGVPTCPTATVGTNTTQVASTAFVAQAITAQPAGVTTFNGRNGAVTLTPADVTTAGAAPTASPTFTGTPAVPTASPGTNTTQAASTAFVAASFAPIASVPLASSTTPVMDGTAAIGAGTTWARADHVHPSDTTKLSTGVIAIQRFTASGTYTPTAGMKSCVIEAVGGGAGGNGYVGVSGSYSVGGGGGGGAYAKKFATAATIGASQTVTIGTAGAAGAATSTGYGGAGGDTSVGAICIAKGAPATFSINFGGQGGSAAASTGDFTMAGQYGQNGSQIAQSSGAISCSGGGGQSLYGFGAQQSAVSAGQVVGNPAIGYGGGGGGGSTGTATGVAGGAGGAGLVIITELG